MRREGDEVRLVAVLAQVVFRCVRIVFFFSGHGLKLKRLSFSRSDIFFPEQDCATSSA